MATQHQNIATRADDAVAQAKTSQGPDLPTVPAEYHGKWLAWDAGRNRILAAADTYSEIMKFATEHEQSDLVVEKAPGLHPTVAARPFVLLDDESANILEDVRNTIPDSEQWLDTPNTRLWCQKPRDLIGTPQEKYLRYVVRGLRTGISS